jgi:hypothetical protein
MTDLSMDFSVNWNDGTGDEALTNTVEWRTEVQTEADGKVMYDTDNFFDQYIDDLKSFLAGLMLHPQSDSCSSSFRVHGEFSYWIDQYLIYHELIDPEAVRFAVDTQILDETESAPTLTVRVPDGASFAPGEVIPMTLHFSEPVQLPRGFCLRINGQDCPVLDFSACTAEDESAVLHASQSDFTIAYTATAEDAAGSLTLDPSASTLSGLTNTFGVYLDSDFDPATDDAATVIASAVSNSGIFIDLTALDDQDHQPPAHLSQHLGHLFYLPTPIESSSNSWGFSPPVGLKKKSLHPCVCLCPLPTCSPAVPLRTF